ncbi:hypothetical protein A2U01_0115852, partial [Trifolium medium]|nr:hypothetical protein [Trifolium medium]
GSGTCAPRSDMWRVAPVLEQQQGTLLGVAHRAVLVGAPRS